jgi:hypothetical protein
MKQYFQNWLQLFSVVVIVFLLIKIFVLSTEKSSYESITKNQIKALQERSNKIIKDKEQQIEYLIKRNALTDIEIKRKQKSIDSLEAIKKQVQVIYIDNVKAIRGFNAKQLENYFRNEIK